ncbi:MAG: DUF6737 family protein [Microcoleaceae cyanobacterium]
MDKQPEAQSFNPWNSKPWWCQPWSIILTGTTLILTSYFLFHRPWIVLIVALPILAWMGFFLIIWPEMMKQLMAGDESTKVL